MDNIGLPNIIMGRRIMPELWQNAVTAEHIAQIVIPMLTDVKRHRELSDAMTAVRRTMGESGSIDRTATAILHFVKEKHAE
uniref:CAZy families GT19 protein n=1 Tax=uncultured Veillonella sp. TaxID=159268 RepID=A0A060BW43_9FIRM|nr:CAZy families GT19 protein [uncultured Veillonella sp.]